MMRGTSARRLSHERCSKYLFAACMILFLLAEGVEASLSTICMRDPYLCENGQRRLAQFQSRTKTDQKGQNKVEPTMDLGAGPELDTDPDVVTLTLIEEEDQTLPLAPAPSPPQSTSVNNEAASSTAQLPPSAGDISLLDIIEDHTDAPESEEEIDVDFPEQVYLGLEGFPPLEPETSSPGIQESNSVTIDTGSSTQGGIPGGSVQGSTQGGTAQGGIQGGNFQGGIQGGNFQGGIQGGNVQGGIQGGNVQGGIQGGNAQGGIQGGNVQGGIQGGYAQGGIQGGYAQGGIQGGNVQGGIQGGNVQGGIQGGNAQGGIQGGVQRGPVYVGQAPPGGIFGGAPPGALPGGPTNTGSLPSGNVSPETALPLNLNLTAPLIESPPEGKDAEFFGQVNADLCPCTDAVPSGAFNCMQVRFQGECELDSILNGPSDVPEGFCEITCGRCKCCTDMLTMSSRRGLDTFRRLFQTMADAQGSRSIGRSLQNPSFETTVFAPTNDAFARMFYSLNMTLDDFLTEPSLMNQIMTYHVLLGPTAASEEELATGFLGTTLPTVNAAAFVSVNATGPVLSVGGIGSFANVIVPNVYACKSIFHVVDEVLLPFDPEGLQG